MKKSTIPKLRRVLLRLRLDPVNRHLLCVGLGDEYVGLVITKFGRITKLLEVLTMEQVSTIENKLIYAPVFCSTWILNDSKALGAAKSGANKPKNKPSTRDKRNATSTARRERKHEAELEALIREENLDNNAAANSLAQED